MARHKRSTPPNLKIKSCLNWFYQFFPMFVQSFEAEVCYGLVSHPDFAFHGSTHWVSTHFPWTVLWRARVWAVNTRLRKKRPAILLPTSPSTPTLPGLHPWKSNEFVPNKEDHFAKGNGISTPIMTFPGGDLLVFKGVCFKWQQYKGINRLQCTYIHIHFLKKKLQKFPSKESSTQRFTQNNPSKTTSRPRKVPKKLLRKPLDNRFPTNSSLVMCLGGVAVTGPQTVVMEWLEDWVRSKVYYSCSWFLRR